MKKQNNIKRKIGLEQEFFLVEESGKLCDRADEFLQTCQTLAQDQGYNIHYFVPEFVKNMVEINTPPCYSSEALGKVYLQNLQLAITAGHKIGLRLYPLSSYPLHIMPVMRDKPNYHLQARTVGYDRFLHAGKCTGTHVHLEVPPGVIDSRVGVAYESSSEDKQELLNIYNLATALDSALIALGRSCPYYEGESFGLASHTIRYRGSEKFGWEGVYTHLQPVGGLMPYADCIETLVENQFSRFHAWLQAMEKVGINRQQFFEAGGSFLKSSWNPIRLNGLGTVEIRCLDSNLPAVILAMITLIEKISHWVRQEGLKVLSAEGVQVFQQEGNTIRVPSFDYLNGDLLYAAATEGVKHPYVKAYVDSILELAIADGGDGTQYLTKLRQKLDHYQSIEGEILQTFNSTTAHLSREEGLNLVLHYCDALESQVDYLNRDYPLKTLDEITVL
ncbi:glutamate-cysteine ligase family protein [Crocosphaera sp.]|uniref:glutamate-cysteine ligase family protein n=1 Tax=Crocosphaera sp. TaxID=2729996 RepID=UPI003F1F0ED8|nr:glutamate-cysteine ligase family protein [Crocosphaera sp.]